MRSILFNKNTFILICLIGLGVVSIAASVLGYWRLDRVPYGYHVDELSTAVDVGWQNS